MRRKFEELRENLEEFVQQDEYPVLVVGCVSEELAYMIKFLQALQDKHAEHWFVIFSHAFETPSRYLDGVVTNLQLQVGAAGPLRAERGEPPFPPLSPELSDSNRNPRERLHDVLCYLRSLLPDASAHRMVVGLLPLSCADYEAYIRLIAAVVPAPNFAPWMDATRVVAYDDRTRHWLTDAMRKREIDHVLTFDVDLSTPALADALGRDAADPALPVQERMASLMQLAALDFSYSRHADAIEKYGILHNYYHGAGIPIMQALALLGVGDALRMSGEPDLAKQRLQQGIAVAMEHKCLPVLLNLLISAAHTCMELRHFEDAESYADSGTKVAAAVLNPFVYADLYELKGAAQVAQDNLSGGMEWSKRCAELWKTYEYFFRWTSVLERQRELCARMQLADDEQAVADELQSVRALEQQGGRSAPQAQS